MDQIESATAREVRELREAARAIVPAGWRVCASANFQAGDHEDGRAYDCAPSYRVGAGPHIASPCVDGGGRTAAAALADLRRSLERGVPTCEHCGAPRRAA